MEFDWSHSIWQGDSTITKDDVEESFEDPFAVRLLPEISKKALSRYFNLGCTSEGKGVFSVYRTNGKFVQIIAARPFTQEEWLFYNKRMFRLLHK